MNINKEKNNHLNANKMILNTTNKDSFKDFQVVPVNGMNRRSQSVAQLPDKPIVLAERSQRDPNDSNNFKGTLSYASPFFNKTSYQNNFQNFGGGKSPISNL